ncbi:ABC transporter substrate-binding protein [Paracraurococcus ruber]|uniref:Nitrate ABC transporter substrate-binding protein n=1 Tax=Paracraurococcus ruber TaxID=77675 RepID=A0ABS1CWK1_9PROT|nr:ABC transporter substrate-binding protein [Paracraurococcus ruber]MBK1658753.1 nitrate ABC transporter substrate-binding protein [Paracraurococcus ruber]TDG32065.1 ABC transporter substrate-binding protein [Paracraurococcus ruber]
MAIQRFTVSRRAALGLLGAGAPLLVAAPGPVRAQPRLDRLSFVTNWRAQAEHGGFYQAQAAGLYRQAGLEVELRTGGPQINPAQLLLGGRVDMSMGNGLSALNFVRESIPFLCIGAIFQKDMQVLIAHPNTGLTGFEALRGRTILVGAEARVTWWPFLVRKYGLREDQLRPYTFNLQPFLADRQIVQQGYLGSEPFSIREAGIQPDTLLLHDAGFENYGTTINIGQRTLAEKRDAIQRFMDATMAGWDQYLKGPAGGFDTAAANALIKQHNPEMPDALLAFGTRMMNEAGIVRSGDAATLGIGAMTEARWQRFHAAVAEVGVLPRDLDWRRAFDLSLVNRGIGKA